MDAVTAGAAVTAAAAVAGAWQLGCRARRAEHQIRTLSRELRIAHRAACHDPLTGLLNRRAFFQRGVDVVADHDRHPLAVLVIDLDDFKEINDRLGHAAGDRVLVTVAQRLADHAGGMVARLGGDEFAGLLAVPTIDRPQLDQLADHLTELVNRPVRVGANLVTVSASVGLAAIRSTDPALLAEALHEADRDMYAAKSDRDRRRPAVTIPRPAGQPAPQIRAATTRPVTRPLGRAPRHHNPVPAAAAQPP